jgi:hypothetical protein
MDTLANIQVILDMYKDSLIDKDRAIMEILDELEMAGKLK